MLPYPRAIVINSVEANHTVGQKDAHVKRFLEHFHPDDPPQGCPSADCLSTAEPIASGISSFLMSHGGCSFRQGLYRLHTPSSVMHWTRLTVEAFPRLGSRVFCFGYDWLGRQFALDRARMENGQAQVMLVDLGFNVRGRSKPAR